MDSSSFGCSPDVPDRGERRSAQQMGTLKGSRAEICWRTPLDFGISTYRTGCGWHGPLRTSRLACF
jgi:hypothetical protein